MRASIILGCIFIGASISNAAGKPMIDTEGLGLFCVLMLALDFVDLFWGRK